MLSVERKKKLKSQAHAIKPVVTVAGKGLTENVLNEIDIALNAHELIKVKIAGYEREDKKAIIAQILEKSGAEEIQMIGHIVVLWRQKNA